MATVTTTGGGGWAAIARKDAAVEKKPDIQSLRSTAGLKTVVVDANAIIGGGVKLSGIADQFFTVKEVLAEIRDPASRFHLATLPVEIKCLEPSEQALTRVAQFARATGDVQSLSEVDMKVIALTYTLEAQVHGTDHIRTRPPPLILTPSKSGPRSRDPPGWGSVANPEEWEGIEDEADGGVNTGSRILGLKSLSLDTQEPNSTRDDGLNTEELLVDSNPVHDSKGSGSPTAEAANSAVFIPEKEEETPHADVVDVKTTETEPAVDPAVFRNSKSDETTAAEVDNFAPVVSQTTETLQESDSSKNTDAFAASSKAVGNKQMTKSGEADMNGEDWQRAISRSTRRQYQKRAQRRALQQQLAESSATVSEAGYTDNDSKGEKYAKEHSDERSGHGGAFFRPDISAGEVAKQENAGAFGVESVDFTDEGIHEDETGRDGAERVCDESSHDDDSASNTAESSVVDTEQSWTVTPMWTSSIACMTADYAMQNVILQMGLRLLSSSGQHVKELNRWILKCQACFKVTAETDRLFCPKCGNGGTLYKVSITVGPNGCVLAGRSRRPILRGTKYSLPLPKGGREGAVINPILREDQLPAKPRKVKKPEFEAFSSSDVVFAHPHERKGQKGASVKAAAAIFSGRRNPNERRRSHK